MLDVDDLIVAVLVPSRSNPKGLQDLVFSLLMTIPEKSFEVLVALDTCDPILDSYRELNFQGDRVRIFEGDRGRGYNDLNIRYTELAGRSEAPWVWPMDDDAFVEGSGWIEQLAWVPSSGFLAYAEWYGLGASRYYHAEGHFPIVPNRSWIKRGYAKIEHPSDRWLDQTLRVDSGWRSIFLAGVTIMHDGRPR